MNATRFVVPIYLLFILGRSSPVTAWPIDPPALDRFYYDADLVVIAQVGRTVTVDDARIEQGTHLTQLTIIQQFKGKKPPTREIVVETREGGGCPYDAKYRANTIVLTFLDRAGGGENYRTHLVEHGYRELDEFDATSYAALFHAFEAIALLPEKNVRPDRLLEVYVQSAINPQTRNVGVDGIRQTLSSNRYGKSPQLTETQRQRLVEAVIAERPPQRRCEGLIWLLRDYPNKALDRYLIEALRRSNKPGWSNVTQTVVEVLPKRLDIAIPEELELRLLNFFSREWNTNTYDPRADRKQLDEERMELVDEFLQYLERTKPLPKFNGGKTIDAVQ